VISPHGRGRAGPALSFSNAPAGRGLRSEMSPIAALAVSRLVNRFDKESRCVALPPHIPTNTATNFFFGVEAGTDSASHGSQRLGVRMGASRRRSIRQLKTGTWPTWHAACQRRHYGEILEGWMQWRGRSDASDGR
jgi:hypothetical protein